jgi:hypothetical protein
MLLLLIIVPALVQALNIPISGKTILVKFIYKFNFFYELSNKILDFFRQINWERFHMQFQWFPTDRGVEWL